jgi:uncharacterized SAM-binding protein YcdF (DUF218 family)
MFLLITRLILWLLILWALWIFFKKVVPLNYYTYLGIFGLSILAILFLFNPADRFADTAWGIVSFGVRPLGIALVLIGMAVLDGKKEISKQGSSLVTIAFWILLISSIPLVPNLLYQNFIERDAQTLVSNSSTQGASAIVLLGRNTTEPQLPGRPQIQLKDQGDLIDYAANLYQQTGLSVIVSAGRRNDLPSGAGEQVEANDIQTLLEQRGVRSGSIIIEPNGVNIRSSAEGVKRILDQTGLGNRVIIVSSTTQVYRAAQTFKSLGISVVPRPSSFVSFNLPNANVLSRVRLQDFVPTLEGLTRTTQVTDEYLATIYYFLRGWLSPDELVRPR